MSFYIGRPVNVDPTIVMTMLAGAVSALFGILVAQYRARDAEQKDTIKKLETKIETLETRLLQRDDVVAKNTETLDKVAEAQATSVTLLKDVAAFLQQGRHLGGSSQ